MSAKLNRDGEAEVELKSPLRDGLKVPSEEEVAACRPCRLALVVLFSLVLVAMLVSAIVVIATSGRCKPKGNPPKEFWRKELAYQIYVPSFQDSNDDGYGDVKGIQNHVTYLQEIGVKIIVLSGIVGKNDFRDFKRPEYALSHFEELVKKAKDAGISVVLEIDPTYTEVSSDWFKNSRKDNTSVYNDWYIWRKSQNNWESKAGGIAWKFDRPRYHYYYYYVDVNKPALNYNNTSVRKELKDALTYWMAKGVKGFKLNNFQRLIVDSSFNDNPSSKAMYYDKDHKGSHILLQELRSVVAAKGGFLMGALEIDDAAKTKSYFGTKDKRELDLVLNTVFTGTPRGKDGEFVNTTIADYQKAVPQFSWPSWIFDGPEYLNRLGKRYTVEKLFYLHIVLQLALPGSTVFYYGDEIRLKVNATEAMSWSGAKINGGFSKANPWFSPRTQITPYTSVEDQKKKKQDSFAIFKQLSLLRQKEVSLQSNMIKVAYAQENVIVFHRYEVGNKGFIFALNFGLTTVTANIKVANAAKGDIVLDTLFAQKDRKLNLETIKLEPHQGLVIRVTM